MNRPRPPRPSGQSLVEFALLLPIIIFIVLFVLDLGRAVYYTSTLYNSAREGARYGITSYRISNNGSIIIDSTGIDAAARAQAIGLKPGDLTVASNLVGSPPTRPVKLVVTATYRFRAVTPIIWDFLSSNPVVLQSQSTMNMEY